MAALSHGVVRVDSEDSLTSLTLQDCGQVMPGASMVVVRSEGAPILCKTDQVGEICVTSGATGTSYFGLLFRKPFFWFSVYININGKLHCRFGRNDKLHI